MGPLSIDAEGDVERVTSARFSPSFRSKHIGASQWAAACGLDPYTAPIELFERFVGLVPWEDPMRDENEAIELGHLLEDPVARRAAKILGVQVEEGRTLMHPDHNFLIATPDRFIRGARALMEVKTTGLTSPSKAYVEDWGEEGTDEVPRRVAVQCTAQLFVARAAGIDVEHVVVAALIPHRGVQTFVIDYDDDLARLLAQRVTTFWQHVQDREPPPADVGHLGEYLERRWPEHNKGQWLDATSNEVIVGEARILKEARAQLEHWKKIEQGARNAICGFLRDHEGCTGPFGKIAWRGVRGREHLNIEGFLAAARAQFGTEAIDEIVKKNTARGQGHRRFEARWADEEK